MPKGVIWAHSTEAFEWRGLNQANDRLEEGVMTMQGEALQGESHGLEGKGTLRREPGPPKQKIIIYWVYPKPKGQVFLPKYER